MLSIEFTAVLLLGVALHLGDEFIVVVRTHDLSTRRTRNFLGHGSTPFALPRIQPAFDPVRRPQPRQGLPDDKVVNPAQVVQDLSHPHKAGRADGRSPGV